MNEKIAVKGSCICGSVKIDAKAASKNIGACHCMTCRRWGGGPLMATDCGTEVEFEGEQAISSYSSSEWAERGFCSKCGSHLFYRLKGSGQYMLPVGLFDTNFIFDHQVFIEERPSYYCFANETKNMTGVEMFAKFGADK